jgi:hypothetical protein
MIEWEIVNDKSSYWKPWVLRRFGVEWDRFHTKEEAVQYRNRLIKKK